MYSDLSIDLFITLISLMDTICIHRNVRANVVELELPNHLTSSLLPTLYTIICIFYAATCGLFTLSIGSYTWYYASRTQMGCSYLFLW
jgi:hypothetical protein